MEDNIIYLTFDDGPGNYTCEFLDILKKYHIKATFFITGNDYDDEIIKRIYNEGHTIGLHSYSHKYDEIYKSEEAFFKDIDKIKNKVFKIVGISPNLIRFPGGSSNTVSKFNNGIMTRLTELIASKGYFYVDWNVDSNDIGKIGSSEIFKNVISSLEEKKTYIVLMHDIVFESADALEKIIKYGLENGYKFDKIDVVTTKLIHHRIFN